MIKQILENFPKVDGKPVATLSSATVTLQDMAERTISSTVKFNGQTPPDFSQDWEVEYNGERYIMPLRKPQGAKDHTSLNATSELTFYNWAEYQLKRYYFFTIQSVDTDQYIPDQYIASVSLPLTDFIELFNKVLNYYFGDVFTMKLAEAWQGKTDPEPVNILISHSSLWNVLIQFYELFAMRWKIVHSGNRYEIIIGASEPEIPHIFQYRYDGGLLKVDRQVQDESIRNILYGRGSEKNLPLRYFKRKDPDNPTFAADPDAIPELENVYFSELRSKEFRDYVQGWKCNPNRKMVFSDGEAVAIEKVDTKRTEWAYIKGTTDSKFEPPEYVKDDVSIARYGELVGSLENNEDIYPSIQGRSDDAIGRIDEAVDVEQVSNDDVILDSAGSQAQISNIEGTKATFEYPAVDVSGKTITFDLKQRSVFSVPSERHGVLLLDSPKIVVQRIYDGETSSLSEYNDWEITATVESVTDSFGTICSAANLEAGTYSYSVNIKIQIKDTAKYGTLKVSAEISGGKLTTAKISDPEADNRTFRVWIKNIWGTTKGDYETNEDYVDRVWQPILGDGKNSEAKLVFATGQLSTSEDYEFKIIKICHDPSRRIAIGENDLGLTVYAKSEWCLTVEKSDADYESTGLFVPSTHRQGAAGDFFFFTGIELPHLYVVLAEKEIQNYKFEELAKLSDISPTWQVSVDRVRAGEIIGGKPLRDWLTPGASLRLSDKRFILNENDEQAAYETLYIQSVTLSYREPTKDDAALNPDIELVLSNNYSTTASPVATLQGSVEALSRRLGALGNIEQIIRAVSDKLYLRKDGIADRSVSPTEFANLLTSYQFRQGMIGGQGWGFYRDTNGNWVLETDRIKARQDFEVNNLIVNQIQSRGGMIVESAAAMEITSVELTSEGYICYFDQKQGSVKNLFHVDDVALCHRFDPALYATPAEVASTHSDYEKFYKRRVLRVSQDSVLLAKNMPDVNGSGIPSEGDVIVHYGNYTDATRRFVIVRDVVGGGYERFIEGLASVDHTGKEYYYVGRQNGMYGNVARFFLGNDDNFIEFLNGVLNIKAQLSVQSTIGGTNIDKYISAHANVDTDNYALMTSTPLEIQVTGNPTDVLIYEVAGLDVGDIVKCAFDYEAVDLVEDGPAKSLIMAVYDENNRRVTTANSVAITKLTLNQWQHYNTTSTPKLTVSGTKMYLRFYLSGYTSGTVRIKNLIVYNGVNELRWRPSSKDTDTLCRALLGNTTISGGLVLTSVIETGEQNGETFTVRAGISGLADNQHPHGGVVFWGGGTYQQASEGNSTYVIYMDGTGHAAGGTIKFQENNLQVGDIISLNDAGLEMTDAGGSSRMSLGDFSVKGGDKYLYIMNATLQKDFERFSADKGLIFPSKGGGWALTVLYNITANGILSLSVSNAEPLIVHLGKVLKGSKITLHDVSGNNTLKNFILSSSQDPLPSFTGISAVFPKIRIEAFNNNTNSFIQGTQRNNNPKYNSGGVYWGLQDFEWTADDDYDSVDIRISLVNNGTPTNGTDTTITIGYATNADNIRVKNTLPEYNETRLGNDGMMFSWGNSNLFQIDNFWGVRVGSYGLQVNPKGLRVLKDDIWHDVDISKIIKS